MVPQWIIEKKRDGGELSEKEIRYFIAAYSKGELPDYQMSALAMAICIRGMNETETAVLTDAMMRSGDLLSWSYLSSPTADKHSTGGIGDKLSLIVAPLAATQGVAVPMIAGRGLGITGGTLDKLDSIPGFSTHLSGEEFRKIVATLGVCITGQTENLVPADRKLYALRDVTGTVPSIPLITASIMSKKLAEGAASLVFDVKYGRAAFMKTRTDADRLAESLIRTGEALGRKCSAFVNPMDCPTGRAVGNALEVIEALEVLKNKGPADARELSLRFACEMVRLSFPDRAEGDVRAALECAIADGAAFEKFRKMIEAQGGNHLSVDDETLLPRAKNTVVISAEHSSVVEDVDAEKIGRLVLKLGGGRTAANAPIDYSAGVDQLVQKGESVEKGQTLMRVHSNIPFDAAEARAAISLRS